MTNPSITSKHPIVVGFDFSPIAERVLLRALEESERTAHAELHVVHVTQAVRDGFVLPRSDSTSFEEESSDRLRKAVAEVVGGFIREGHALGIDRVATYAITDFPASSAGTVLVNVAREVEAELIVVGTHGKNALERVVLGSVASYVLHHADCSVLVVRPSDFVGGRKVPEIEPPLEPGQPHLRQFKHRHVYHYVNVGEGASERLLPVG